MFECVSQANDAVKDLVLTSIVPDKRVDRNNRTIVSFVLVGPMVNEQNAFTGEQSIKVCVSLLFLFTLSLSLPPFLLSSSLPLFQQTYCLIIFIVHVVSHETVACSRYDH